MDTDRNLLFGVLALQADLLDTEQFTEACAEWARRKDTPLGELLIERGWLTQADKSAIDRQVERKVQRHGSPTASLAAAADREVRRVLAALDDPEIRNTCTGLMPETEPGAFLPGDAEGKRYTRTRLHATGGTGRVWLARDNELGRVVALKELRPEAVVQPTLCTRFLEEAVITGQLEHPGVVPIYELARRAGEREPFYTMRFIKGRNLSEAVRAYHDRRRAGEDTALDQANLLQAFVAVCNTVAYAHARGVIHRDLKGLNVAVGDFGEVMVLDWGMAKLVDRPEGGAGEPPVAVELNGGTREETRPGQVMGTPGYMAPEQAAGRQDQVGTHTDVYGLGAILYEILTGHPPFTDSDLAEVLRQVREEAPVPPRNLCPTAPPALEAVCLRALTKRPADRYPSAAALAREVQRWQAGEPVDAYPEPFTVRLGRWAKRHRALVAGLAVLLLIAVPVLLFSTWRIGREKAATEQARVTAEKNFQEALNALDTYFTQVSESRLLNVPGQQPLRHELLQLALSHYQRFTEEHADDPRLRLEIGKALGRLGNLTGELETKQKALDFYDRALTVFEGLHREDPAEPRVRRYLGTVGHNRGMALLDLGRPDEALAALHKSLDILKQLNEDHPGNAEFRDEWARAWNDLGISAGVIGQLGPSEEAYRQAGDIWDSLAREHPDNPDYSRRLASIHYNLGLVYHMTGRLDQAETLLRQALAERKRLADAEPSALALQRELVFSYGELGSFLSQNGKQEEALSELREAIAVGDRLARDNPQVIAYQRDITHLFNNRAAAFYTLGRHEDARKDYERVRDMREKLVREYPDQPEYQKDLIASYGNLGSVYEKLGRLTEAGEADAKAVQLAEQLAREHPDLLEVQVRLGQTYTNLGIFRRDHGQPREALSSFDKAVPVFESVLRKEPRHALARDMLGKLYVWRAELLRDSERYADSLRNWDEALKLDKGQFHDFLVLARAVTRARQGDYPTALAEAAELMKKFAPGQPAPALHCYQMAQLSARVSAAVRADLKLPTAERDRQAEERASQALGWLEKARSAGLFQNPQTVKEFRGDGDFEPLKGRKDFQEFANRIEKEAKK